MRVIITGATGFIGRNLAEGLQRDGHQVVATGRSRAVGAELAEEGLDFRPADLRDNSEVEAVFEPADSVVHCAGRAGDWGRYEDFYSANVTGTQHVIQACRRHGIPRIIFLSTPSVYFNGRDRLNISEDAPLPERQTEHYGRTKLLAEQELMWSSRRGLQVIILRPRAVYGPHDGTIMPRILKMGEKPRLPLIGGGRALVDITYIDNLTDAVRLCLRADDRHWNQVYNVSNGDPLTLREWFRQVLEVFGRPFRPIHVPVSVARTLAVISEAASRLPDGPKEPSLTRFSVGYMSRSMTLSLAKARARLGFEPTVSSRRGFQLYAGWAKGK